VTRKVVLAYSGGLDTSYCILELRERGLEVHAVTVDTGGFKPDELKAMGEKALKLGAASYRAVDARAEVYEGFVTYIIKGNVLRGGVYPLCVAAERVQQAISCATVVKELGADAVAHGSTGAGNDQVRFDAALRTLLPGIELITPIREKIVARATSTAALRAAGFEVEDKTTDYSINTSLWGTTIGGKETHDAWLCPGEDVYEMTRSPDDCAEPVELVLRFAEGLPVALDGEEVDGVTLIERLNVLGGERGVGRGMHLGDTILGIKGRIAFEAPAPMILVRAHKELEKLVLTNWQQHWKDTLSSFYGKLLHEALYFDPVMRDIEAYLDSSQGMVTGEVRVRLAAGRIEVRGVRSENSLVAPRIARYGEDNAYWDGADARGFAKLFPLQAAIASWRDAAAAD